MKLIITSQGKDLDDLVDERFGRAENFIVYDTESKVFKAISNAENVDAAQGAGTQAAQIVAAEKPDAVITGHCGPKAFQALRAAGIPVFAGATGTVAEAIDTYRDGTLIETNNPNVAGHW